MNDDSPPVSDNPFRYVHSPALPALLRELGVTLLVSTYQAGKLVVVRAAGDRLSILLRSFDQAMGIAVDPQRLTIGTRQARAECDRSIAWRRTILCGNCEAPSTSTTAARS